MTCGWPSTSESPTPQRALIASLHHQPLLVVLRALEPLTLLPQLERLQALGVRHVELAWSDHPAWVAQCQALRALVPNCQLGAASVCSLAGVEAAVAAGLGYVVSPVLDEALVQRARDLGVVLVPGVMSPSEVHQARAWGCELVKLFPARSLGIDYWRRLAAPLGRLPFCIAAGGLAVADVQPWLQAGVNAVALGGSLADATDWEALAALVERLRCKASEPTSASPAPP